MENFYNQDWWEKWSRKTFNKGKILLNKITRGSNNKQLIIKN
jgi:hypothetical protein